MSTAKPNICIVSDLAAVWDEGARRFAAAAQTAVADHGRFMVALSGGSTPEGLYRELATRHRASGADEPSDALHVPWRQTHIFFGDERYVPHDDSKSNFRMAREALLDHVPIPANQVHAMPTAADDANLAAVEYEKTLAEEFGIQRPGVGSPTSDVGSQSDWPQDTASHAPLPRFDLILLGMGPDGHTASLFPGGSAVHERRHWVVAPWVEKFQTFRLTLTPPVINRARQIIFLVSSAEKANTLRDVLEGEHNPSRLPSQIVQPVDGQLTWLVDRDAAAKLSSSNS